MIFAEKIIRLRKKNGWSQEELADKMNVSRQAVSKWEAAQTTPNLEKILMMGDLFGVTTDYLLKNEIEEEEFIEDGSDYLHRSVTLEDANAYMEHRKWASRKIALATFLCILSPICLIIMSEISGNVAILLGLIVLFLFVATAVAIYIYVEEKNRPYMYLYTDAFELAYGVSGMVKERQKDFHSVYVKSNIFGTCLCILAPIILLIAAFTGDTLDTIIALSVMLVIIGIAVYIFISVGVKWASMERLLGEGEFSEKGKAERKTIGAIKIVYWLLVTTIYIVWSFWTNAWGVTWLLWPVAGVIFAALVVIVNVFARKKRKLQEETIDDMLVKKIATEYVNKHSKAFEELGK